jgi:membrane protease YdiL (CAAX protease family)
MRGSHSVRDVTQDREARGGLSPLAILTGVVVAFGALFLLSAIVGGILSAIGVEEGGVGREEAIQAGVGAGISLVVATLIAYFWGGYTSGRMARGAGVLNGVLVPIVALIIGFVVGLIVTALGATANLNLPFSQNQLPVKENQLVDFGTWVGIAALIAMFVAAAIGGALGARWHTKLERQ